MKVLGMIALCRNGALISAHIEVGKLAYLPPSLSRYHLQCYA